MKQIIKNSQECNKFIEKLKTKFPKLNIYMIDTDLFDIFGSNCVLDFNREGDDDVYVLTSITLSEHLINLKLLEFLKKEIGFKDIKFHISGAEGSGDINIAFID